MYTMELDGFIIMHEGLCTLEIANDLAIATYHFQALGGLLPCGLAWSRTLGYNILQVFKLPIEKSQQIKLHRTW